eukprot:3438387-Pyramimonas_sp.AAC.1
MSVKLWPYGMSNIADTSSSRGLLNASCNDELPLTAASQEGSVSAVNCWTQGSRALLRTLPSVDMSPIILSPEAFLGRSLPITTNVWAGQTSRDSAQLRRSARAPRPTSGRRSRSPGDTRSTPRP